MNDHLGGEAQQLSESTSALDIVMINHLYEAIDRLENINTNASHLTEAFNLIHRFKFYSDGDGRGKRVCLSALLG
jgi:hypothetical protein